MRVFCYVCRNQKDLAMILDGWKPICEDCCNRLLGGKREWEEPEAEVIRMPPKVEDEPIVLVENWDQTVTAPSEPGVFMIWENYP